MHTPIDFYAIVPRDLYRRGTSTKHKLEYLRTHPPREEDAVWDVAVVEVDGRWYVDSKSGGVSLFVTQPKAGRRGEHWWVIPRGTSLGPGLVLTKDTGSDGRHHGHYTLRPIHDMPVDDFIAALQRLGDMAARKVDASTGGGHATA